MNKSDLIVGQQGVLKMRSYGEPIPKEFSTGTNWGCILARKYRDTIKSTQDPTAA